MEALQQIGAVAVVLGLLACALWWLRRRGLASLAFPARRSGRSLESLERLTLGPQHVLHLVRFRDRVLLLAASPGGCSLLDQSTLPGAGDRQFREVNS
jgi:flagellar biosynthetic protein FliO